MKKIKYGILFLTFIILVIIFHITTTKIVPSASYNTDVIYIDAGHGGFDGGATSKNKQILEKDINLKVSLALKRYLEKIGKKVLLTRSKDIALDKTKKGDIKKRVDLINKSNAILYISIHTNAFPSESIKGAQVFYKKNDESSKILANILTKSISNLDTSNKRVEKEITGKYLIDNVTKQGALVEIGFLTNKQDLANLTNDDYIEKLAFRIYYGIIEYLEVISYGNNNTNKLNR